VNTRSARRMRWLLLQRLSMIRSSILVSVICSMGWLVVGCSGSSVDADPFDTFQACYDEHHGTEGLPVVKAIEICCIDHPIGGTAANVVCGTTTASCNTYVTANLMDAADTMLAADITAACTAYPTDRSK
jgi:hypothetical protein